MEENQPERNLSSFSKSRGVLLYHGPVVTRAHNGWTTLFLFNMVEPSDVSGKFSAFVCLTEDDSPRAKLPKGSPEECNCMLDAEMLPGGSVEEAEQRGERQRLFKGKMLEWFDESLSNRIILWLTLYLLFSGSKII